MYPKWSQELCAGSDLGSSGPVCRHSQLRQVNGWIQCPGNVLFRWDLIRLKMFYFFFLRVLRVYSTHTKKKAVTVSKMSSGQPAEGGEVSGVFTSEVHNLVFSVQNEMKHLKCVLLCPFCACEVTGLLFCRPSSTECSTTTAWGPSFAVFPSRRMARSFLPQVNS